MAEQDGIFEKQADKIINNFIEEFAFERRLKPGNSGYPERPDAGDDSDVDFSDPAMSKLRRDVEIFNENPRRPTEDYSPRTSKENEKVHFDNGLEAVEKQVKQAIAEAGGTFDDHASPNMDDHLDILQTYRHVIPEKLERHLWSVYHDICDGLKHHPDTVIKSDHKDLVLGSVEQGADKIQPGSTSEQEEFRPFSQKDEIIGEILTSGFPDLYHEVEITKQLNYKALLYAQVEVDETLKYLEKLSQTKKRINE